MTKTGTILIPDTPNSDAVSPIRGDRRTDGRRVPVHKATVDRVRRGQPPVAARALTEQRTIRGVAEAGEWGLQSISESSDIIS